MAAERSGLFGEERREQILRILHNENRVAVLDLSARFDCSEDTIRRDLRRLQRRGLIRKTHGGAIRHLTAPDPYQSRLETESDVKAMIGKRAAELVKDGDTIIIDSGSTTLWLAESLKVSKVRVITNSIDVGRVVAEKPNYELILLGGKWDPVHHELAGPVTVEQLSRYRVDKLFLGMVGLDRKHGLTDDSEQDAVLKRAMIQVAEQVIGLADHTKLGAVAFAWVVPASDIDVLVTDTLADCGPFEDLDWEIIKVGVSEKADSATALSEG